MLKLAVDCETTGIGRDDRIVSLAVVSIGGFVEGANYRFEFNPGRPSHPRALEKHGLEDAYLATKPPFAEIAEALHALLHRADLIVAHNAAFDLKMLDREFELCGLPPVATPSFCTMQHARTIWPGESASLDACVARLGLARASHVHGAFEDAMLASALYLHFHGSPIAGERAAPAPLPTATPQPATPQAQRDAEPRPLRFFFWVLVAMAAVGVLLWAVTPGKNSSLGRAAATQGPTLASITAG